MGIYAACGSYVRSSSTLFAVKWSGLRGDGAELRFLGVDSDAIEARARSAGATILQPAKDYPHGWREVMLVDPDGYVWALGVVLPAANKVS